MRNILVAVGVAAVTLAVAAAPLVIGHEGRACGLVTLAEDAYRLEAECYSTAAAICDPGAAEAHAAVVTVAGAHGARVVALPWSACGLSFDDLRVPYAGRFDAARVAVDAPRGARATLEVVADGTLVARADVPSTRGIATVMLEAVATVPDGARDVRVVTSVAPPGRGSRVLLDALEYRVGCANRAPLPPIVAGADGFAGGAFGWVNHAYRFRGLPTSDPDGDPVRYEWEWGDGDRAAGLHAGHSFRSPGPHRVTLVARDDPVGREGCLLTNARAATSEALSFVVVPDWKARLRVEGDPVACEAADAPEARAMAARCRVVASVDARGAPARAVAVASFRVDGEEVARVGPPFEWEHDSSRVRPGPREITVCFLAEADRYAREHCSDRHAYVNVGAGG